MHFSYNLIIHVLSISALATAYPQARDQTSNLYIRDAYSEIHPQLSLQKRYIYPRTEIQPSGDSQPPSRLRRRKEFAPRPSALTPPRPWSSGQNNPNPGPIPLSNTPLPGAGTRPGYPPRNAASGQPPRAAANAFGNGRPGAPPPQISRHPHNTEPATGNDAPLGGLSLRPPPALTSVSGRFPPTNVDHLSPFSDAYRPGLLSSSEPLDHMSPSSGFYRPDSRNRGASNPSLRRRRSQVTPPYKSLLDARSPGSANSFQSGKVAFDPKTRLFTLHTRDALPNAHGHRLRPRGVRSKKKSQNSNPSPGGFPFQDPSTPAAGTLGNADESSAALPLPPSPPPGPRPPPPPPLNPLDSPQSPERPSVPSSPSISSPSPGSGQDSPTSVLPHERHRPNAPPFLPIDPELRHFILGGYARNAESPGSPRSTLEGAERSRSPSSSQSPPSSNGDMQTGRPSVRGRRSQFTGSI